MAEWDDLGITKEEYEEAMSGLHDYLDESGHFDPPSDEDMDRMAADASGVVNEHVETQAEYIARMRKEAQLFKNMPFEQIVQYRIDRKMALTDADKRLINDKIVGEFEAMTEEHDDAMLYYDDRVDSADFVVDQYAVNFDAQREVAGCGKQVPAWMMDEYPIDEQGRALTSAELCAKYEAARADNTQAYESACDKLFARVYDLHVLTTKPNELPVEVTAGKSASPTITPQTFSVLGDRFKAYHAEQIRQQLPGDKSGTIDWSKVQNSIDDTKRAYIGSTSPVMAGEESALMVSSDLPMVDFSKPVKAGMKQSEKVTQTEIGGPQTEGQPRQRMADVALDHEDTIADVMDKRNQHSLPGKKPRSGVSGFDISDGKNSIQGGRSNPDYDFDDYD